jgi:hypothetical protein
VEKIVAGMSVSRKFRASQQLVRFGGNLIQANKIKGLQAIGEPGA